MYCEISVESNTWLLGEIRSIKQSFCFLVLFSLPFATVRIAIRKILICSIGVWEQRQQLSQAAVSHNSTLIISNRTHESISEREKNKAALSPSPLCVCVCVAFFRCLFSVPTTRRAAAVSKHTTLTWENVRNHHIPTTLESLFSLSLSLSLTSLLCACLPASNYRSIDFHLWRHPGMCMCSNNGGGPFFFSLFLLRLLWSFLIFSSRFYSGGPFFERMFPSASGISGWLVFFIF